MGWLAGTAPVAATRELYVRREKTRRAVSAQLSTVPGQLFMRTVVPMQRNDNERSHYQFVDYGSGI